MTLPRGYMIHFQKRDIFVMLNLFQNLRHRPLNKLQKTSKDICHTLITNHITPLCYASLPRLDTEAPYARVLGVPPE